MERCSQSNRHKKQGRLASAYNPAGKAYVLVLTLTFERRLQFIGSEEMYDARQKW